jgi:hypothetical protein
MVRHTVEVHDVAAALYNTLDNTFAVSLVLPMPPNLAGHNPALAHLWEEWSNASVGYQRAFAETRNNIQRVSPGIRARGLPAYLKTPVVVDESLTELDHTDQLFVATYGQNWTAAQELKRLYEVLGKLKQQLLVLLDQAATTPLFGRCLRCKEKRWWQHK